MANTMQKKLERLLLIWRTSRVFAKKHFPKFLNSFILVKLQFFFKIIFSAIKFGPYVNALKKLWILMHVQIFDAFERIFDSVETEKKKFT